MFVQKTITIDVPIAAPVENLAQSASKVLFYPCSGSDLEVPVTHFAPVIDVFWFVDRGYFRPDHWDTSHKGMDRPADSISPIFKHPDFDYIRCTLEGPAVDDRYSVRIKPCVLTEFYLHIPTGRTIQLKFRRGYGFSGFDKEIRKLTVFFHRGDSEGEGGSDNNWYSSRNGRGTIWDKLEDGGWIVTDLSLAYDQDVFRIITDDINSGKIKKVSELLNPSFEFYSHKYNITFTCIGFLGHRYGPTLAFRVDRGDKTTTLLNRK